MFYCFPIVNKRTTRFKNRGHTFVSAIFAPNQQPKNSRNMTAARTLLSGAFGAPASNKSNSSSAATYLPCHLRKGMDAMFESNDYNATVDVSLTPPQRRTSRRKISLESSPTCVADFFLMHDDDSFDRLPSVPISDDESDDAHSLETVEFDSDLFSETWCQEPSGEGKKCVRFLCDGDGDILEDVTLKSYPTYQLSQKDIINLWWSKRDRREAKNSVPRLCVQIIHAFPQYRRAAAHLCTLASRKDYKDLITNNAPTREALPLLTHGDVRGLERPLFYRLALPRKISKTHVHAVLRTQSLLRDMEGDVYSADEKAQLIADQYRENAGFAVRFAEVLAVADAMEAQSEDVSFVKEVPLFNE